MHGEDTSDAALERLRHGARRLLVAETAANVVYWDQRISMKPAASDWRSDQRAWLGELVKQEHRVVDLPRLAEQVEASDPGNREAAAVRRRAEHARSLDAIGRSAYERACSTATNARNASLVSGDAASAIASLAPVLEFARARATAHRPDLEPYDALLDLHEPGMTAAAFDALLQPIVMVSRELMAEHASDSNQHFGDVSLDTEINAEAAHAVEHVALAAVGVSNEQSLVAWSQRAFCSVLGPHDVRLASRFLERKQLRIVLSTLHEAGHAAYAQAWAARKLPPTLHGIASVGVDEASSRIFESHVGASVGFWERIAAALAEHGWDADPHALTAHSRLVLPGVRRIGCDEVTYPLHIAIRFELERALVNGHIELDDLESEWNRRISSMLGVDVPNSREGALQDVHWWLGQLGYFPCYLLGEIYAAQFRAAAGSSDEEMDEALRRGTPPPWQLWLVDNVWSRGAELTGTELVEFLCGQIDSEPFIAHIRKRVSQN
jgi:carboxypeptidase Taq